MTKYKLGSQ